MTAAAVLTVPMAHPADTSGLAVLEPLGLTADDVIAVVAKSEGNGCVNDFTRPMAATAWEAECPGAITVVSGGTEGVLSPHASLVVPSVTSAAGPGLAVGVAATDPIPWWELGRPAQVDAVADAVRRAAAGALLGVGEVALAIVKCPLLTSARVAGAQAAGHTTVTTDGYESMAKSRAASALGVGVAVGELDAAAVQRGLDGDLGVWSAVASTSAGVELQSCHVVVFGNSAASDSPYRIAGGVMRDALDAAAVSALLEVVDADAELVQVFAKAEPDPSGTVRGWRHTMLTDSDVPGTRHARAAVGGLIAGLTGLPAVYVSGGAEHQGPPGGGSLAVVSKVAPVPS